MSKTDQQLLGEERSSVKQKKSIIDDATLEIATEYAKRTAAEVKKALEETWEKSKYKLHGPKSIRFLAFCGGAALFTLFMLGCLNIFGMIAKITLAPRDFIVDAYLGFFGFIIMMVECQDLQFKFLTDRVKPLIEHWFKLMAVIGGRGAFYVFVGLLDTMNNTLVDQLAGVYVFAIGVMCLLIHFQIMRDGHGETEQNKDLESGSLGLAGEVKIVDQV